GLVADVQEDLVAVHLDDDAFHQVAIVEAAEALLDGFDQLLGSQITGRSLGCVGLDVPSPHVSFSARSSGRCAHPKTETAQMAWSGDGDRTPPGRLSVSTCGNRRQWIDPIHRAPAYCSALRDQWPAGAASAQFLAHPRSARRGTLRG